MTALDVYRAFAEFDDVRSTTARAGVPVECASWRGMLFSFGKGTREERDSLEVMDAAYFRRRPAAVLSGFSPGERVLIRRRAQDKPAGRGWQTPFGPRYGFASCWICREK